MIKAILLDLGNVMVPVDFSERLFACGFPAF